MFNCDIKKLVGNYISGIIRGGFLKISGRNFSNDILDCDSAVGQQTSFQLFNSVHIYMSKVHSMKSCAIPLMTSPISYRPLLHANFACRDASYIIKQLNPSPFFTNGETNRLHRKSSGTTGATNHQDPHYVLKSRNLFNEPLSSHYCRTFQDRAEFRRGEIAISRAISRADDDTGEMSERNAILPAGKGRERQVNETFSSLFSFSKRPTGRQERRARCTVSWPVHRASGSG